MKVELCALLSVISNQLKVIIPVKVIDNGDNCYHKGSLSITCFVAHALTHSLQFIIFLNEFKTNANRHFKHGMLDLHIVKVILTAILDLQGY